MTIEEYKKKRKSLCDEAQTLIDEGKINEANLKMQEIEDLDNNFETTAKAKANIKALENDTNYIPSFLIDNVLDNNSSINISGKNIIQSKNKDSIFIHKNEKLENRVKVDDEEKQILSRPNALGDFIRGVVTGKWNDKELKNVITTTSSGVLIPEILSSRIIDLARDISLFTVADVPIVPMESNNMTISRIKTDPVFKFKKEGSEAEPSNFDLDSVKLEAKTCYGYAYVTLEAINSSVNLSSIIYQVFSQAIAQGIDKAFLYGQENSIDEDTKKRFAPLGILNDTSINKIAATTNGGYDDIIRAIGKIKKSNGNPTTLGYNAETEELLSLLKTTDGQYLEAPKQVQELQHIVTNQLAYSADTGSDAIVFDNNALIIGIQNQIQIKIIEDGECLKKGLVGFQIYTMQDCIVTNPNHICRITGIK